MVRAEGGGGEGAGGEGGGDRGGGEGGGGEGGWGEGGGGEGGGEGGGGEGGGEDLRRGLVHALLVRELDDVVRRVGVLRLQHLGDLVAQVLVGQLQLLLRLDVDPRRVPLVGAGHDDLLRLVGGLGHRGRSHRGLGHRRLLRTLWRHADAPRSALASPETSLEPNT